MKSHITAVISVIVFWCALAPSAAAQSGTITDDGFVSSNANTQRLNLNGNGLVLIVAGSSATAGTTPRGGSPSPTSNLI